MPEAAGRGVVAGDLVSPRPAEGVLREWHELDMGEREVCQVVDELVGELAVAEAGAPRPEVHLVHAHRRVVRIGGCALQHPVRVAPGILGRTDHGGRGRRNLGEARHRVCALNPLAARRSELELVGVLRPEARNEQLPDAVVVEPAHGVADAVPVVEVADYPCRRGVWCPHAEAGSRHVFVRAEVCAEHLPELFVAALPPEVEVDFAHGGNEAVRVIRGPVRAVGVTGFERVCLAVAGGEALPQAVGEVLEGDAGAIRLHRGYRGRERPQRTDHEAAIVCVLAQRCVGLRVSSLDDRRDQARVQLRTVCPLSRSASSECGALPPSSVEECPPVCCSSPSTCPSQTRRAGCAPARRKRRAARSCRCPS